MKVKETVFTQVTIITKKNCLTTERQCATLNLQNAKKLSKDSCKTGKGDWPCQS